MSLLIFFQFYDRSASRKLDNNIIIKTSTSRMIGFDGVVASLIKNNRRLWHVYATGITDMRWCWNIPNRDKDNFINLSPPAQNGNHFADDVLTCIFLNENVWISIKTSMKFVPKGPINNIPALVQIMAWRRPGDKPLSETMLTKFTDASMWL